MTKDLWFVSKYKIWSFYSINNRLRYKLQLHYSLSTSNQPFFLPSSLIISSHYQIFAWSQSFKTPNAWPHFLSNIAFLCFNSEKNYRPLQLQESLWAIIRKTCKLQSWNFPRLSPRQEQTVFRHTGRLAYRYSFHYTRRRRHVPIPRQRRAKHLRNSMAKLKLNSIRWSPSSGIGNPLCHGDKYTVPLSLRHNSRSVSCRVVVLPGSPPRCVPWASIITAEMAP